MLTKMRAVFLDRDGVINDLVYRGENFFVHGKKVCWTAPFSYNEFKLRDGVEDSLNKIRGLGFLVILATNQPDVTYGTLSFEDHKRIMADIEKFPLDDIFVCMHGRDDGCECKKPKPGMFLQAAEKWNINLKSSFVIGDMASDVCAGKTAGCGTILIDCNYNKNIEADVRVKDLQGVVEFLKKQS